jgi:hypothetical protein
VTGLCYVYGVAEVAPEDPGPGVTDAPVTTVRQGGLVAVVSEVDAATFDEESLSAHLEDMGWLERTARAHHRIVDAVAGGGAVLPFRLATVFRGPEAVAELLDARSGELSAALERIRGRREWGVKAYAVRPEPATASAPSERPASERPGTDYLLRKRGQRDAAARTTRAAEEQADRLHRTLVARASAARSYPPQDPRLSGRNEPMVLNATYLVAESDEQLLAETVTGSEWTNLEVELTGPWAPYSFAELAVR